jgi:hypothetical protein
MGVRLYAEVPVSILPALFMVSDEQFAEAQALVDAWFNVPCSAYDEECTEAWDAVRGHSLASELLDWRLSGFGKWGVSELENFHPVDDCCGTFERESVEVIFDLFINRLKSKRRYRIDWELFRQHCFRFTWS